MENIMDLVKVERNENYGLVVSSRVVAKALKRRHSDILESIEKLVESKEYQENGNIRSLIFPNEYRVSNQKRKYKEYLLAKDGFILYMFNIQQRLLPMPKSDKVSIPLDKAVHWAKIKEIANKANEVRSDTYRKICKLSQDLVMITNQIDKLSGMTFEVENLLDQIEK